MANAAAKKAAIARKEAANTYLPILAGINIVYILLCLGAQLDLTFWNIAGMISVWGLEFFAYTGILNNAENRNPNDKSLVGGSSLDLLGMTVVIQYGAVLWSPRFYWMLVLVPIWGAWTLYSTFRGGDGVGASKGAKSSTEPAEEDPALADRRQKRSERRRQKRA
ncbi:expressed unknown protein [Seminavis robusta]|uniref:Uncharacterized protein n=1 Tax=Seminavis robusta TaxID=568900 RepID=A0A9N8EKY1_9STRA|nr:expressed unknown protein [Seminavis robusta]|eukprot:Sro1135_g245000.1 n/a (165) ;mRNA; r:4678-5270